MSRTRKPAMPFPVLFCKIFKTDRCYAAGFRYFVEQVSEEHHLFKTRKRAEQFIQIHGMVAVTDQAMKRFRQMK